MIQKPHSNKKLTVAVAGSTQYTLLCAKAIFDSKQFKINLVITSQPKPQGRKKLLKLNPLHKWAKQNNVNLALINNKISTENKKNILKNSFDYLLVVDFGYYIPKWLRDQAKLKSLNIHPSLLPKWRGSSPAQFVLMNNEKKSGVSVIELSKHMDQGNIIDQKQFLVNPSWNYQDYYDYAFKLIAPQLPKLLMDISKEKIKPRVQPKHSPTALARKLTKNDGYISWQKLNKKLINPINSNPVKTNYEASFLKTIYDATKIFNHFKGLHPWPGLWTIIPTKKGNKRMLITQCHLESNQNNEENKLVLDKVKIAGQKESQFNQIKNQIN